MAASVGFTSAVATPIGMRSIGAKDMGGNRQGVLHATIGKAGEMWRVAVSSSAEGLATERLFDKQIDAVVYFLKISSHGQPQDELALNPVF
jgi:hypothetical protein